ncbi:MAG: hypothetical protein AAF810_01295 [Cyanobacteria bacterium P01_D01_bin.36]
MDYSKALENALAKGKELYPSARMQHHAAFANSVAYLVTSASGGYGGPSMREHAVSWALAGDGYNLSAETSIGSVTLQQPDERLPRAGQWDFDKAVEFAKPICYGNLPAVAAKIYQFEHCFDDSPEDIEAVKKLSN